MRRSPAKWICLLTTDLVGECHVGSVVDEHLGHVVMALPRSAVQRSVEVSGDDIRSGSSLQQQLDAFHITLTSGNVQRCLQLLYHQSPGMPLDIRPTLTTGSRQFALRGIPRDSCREEVSRGSRGLDSDVARELATSPRRRRQVREEINDKSATSRVVSCRDVSL